MANFSTAPEMMGFIKTTRRKVIKATGKLQHSMATGMIKAHEEKGVEPPEKLKEVAAKTKIMANKGIPPSQITQEQIKTEMQVQFPEKKSFLQSPWLIGAAVGAAGLIVAFT